MNTAMILSGGVGTRMGTACPKQYLTVAGQPIIAYAMAIFESHPMIDHIVIVASEEWHALIEEWIAKKNITKFAGFAPAGRTRQHSIFNGLLASKGCTPDDGVVIIHDAARPLTAHSIITDCLIGAKEDGGAMPVITVKDTTYFSRDGKQIDQLLDRSCLYAGQAPEAFRFGEYLAIHRTVSDEEIAQTVGTSQIAHKHGMKVRLVKGSERNIKITTIEDLNTFEVILAEQEKGGM